MYKLLYDKHDIFLPYIVINSDKSISGLWAETAKGAISSYTSYKSDNDTTNSIIKDLKNPIIVVEASTLEELELKLLLQGKCYV